MKEGWKYVKLGDICYKICDGSHNPPKGVDMSEYIMLSSQNIKNGSIDFSSARYLSPSAFEIENKRTNIKRGDVLLTIVGTIGRSCVVETDEKNITFQRSVAILKPKEDLNSYFLMYLFWGYNEVMNKMAHGAAQKGLYLKQLSSLQIPLPPLSEQQSIVAHLDASFAEIDALKAKAAEEVANAKAMFDAALREEMTPKEGWEEKTLPDISENLDCRRKPVTKGKREEGIYPYYGASGIVDYVGGFLYDEDILLISEDGANLLARSTPIAFSVSGKVWVNNHAHVLKFPTLTQQYFVEYYFASINISEYVTGAAQPKLSQKNLNIIPIPVPPLADQQHIVAKLDTLRSHLTELEQKYNLIAANCDALKQAILRETFE